MGARVLGVLLLAAVSYRAAEAQLPYGPSQLDSYQRILQSQNIGGFGQLAQAIQNGQVHALGDASAAARLAGLPAIPQQVLLPRQLAPTAITNGDLAAAQPAGGAFRPPPPRGPLANAPRPELPPRPENKLDGVFDNDGNFRPSKPVEPPKNKPEKQQPVNAGQQQGPRIQRSHVQPQFQQLPPHSTAIRMPQSNHGEHGSHRRHHHHQRSAPAGGPTVMRVHPRQVNPAAAARPTPPPFTYRPRPKPTDRTLEYNNLLTEVEEYDDWLEQREAYLQMFPGTRIPNPYDTAPPGTVLFSNVPPRAEGPGPQPQPQAFSAQQSQGPVPGQPQRPPLQQLPSGTVQQPGGHPALVPLPGGPPPLSPIPPPPPLSNILEAQANLTPNSPFENPLVTFISRLFGTQSVVSLGQQPQRVRAARSLDGDSPAAYAEAPTHSLLPSPPSPSLLPPPPSPTYVLPTLEQLQQQHIQHHNELLAHLATPHPLLVSQPQIVTLPPHNVFPSLPSQNHSPLSLPQQQQPRSQIADYDENSNSNLQNSPFAVKPQPLPLLSPSQLIFPNLLPTEFKRL